MVRKVKGTIRAIRAMAGSRLVCVLASTPDPTLALRLREAGMDSLTLADVLRTSADGRERLVIERTPSPAASVRLVIRRSAQTTILDGQSQSLELPMQRFVLLRMLAEQLSRRDPVLLAQTIERERRGIRRR